MVEDMPKKKKSSFELTKKGKIILSIIIGVLAIVIFVLIFNSNNGQDVKLIIDAAPVKEDMKSITYNAGNNTSMKVTTNGTVNLKYSYSDNKDYGIKWVVSDESVVKIDNNKAIGLKAGTVTIYAVSKNYNNVKSNEVVLTFE